MKISCDKFKEIVKLALKEDKVKTDITAKALFSSNLEISYRLISEDTGILCGLPVVEYIYKSLSNKVKIKKLLSDGSKIKKQTIIAQVNGPARILLSAERTVLNFLSHLSGISTLTSEFIKYIKNKKVKIYDTRKTTPGLRYLEKYAVFIGGGNNHRMNLQDMFLVKDNHLDILKTKNVNIDYVGLIKDLKTKHPKKKVEIEVESFYQFKKALAALPDIIMLDNMSLTSIKKCISYKNQLSKDKNLKNVLIEVSGGIRLENISKFSRIQIDRISIGSITNSAPSLNFSIEIS